MPRKTATEELRDVSDVSDDEQGSSDGDNDKTQMLEMLAMLKEFQKRKTAKNTAKSAAFQNKKNALFADARKNAETAVRDGVAYIEQYKSKIAELKELEVSQDQYLKDFALFASQEEALGAVLEVFPAMFEDLSPRRAESINETSAMLEAHSVERLQSRRRLIKHAKARIDEEQENQRIATDASALIKHYKALLLS